jgi:hypothetical protein
LALDLSGKPVNLGIVKDSDVAVGLGFDFNFVAEVHVHAKAFFNDCGTFIFEALIGGS